MSKSTTSRAPVLTRGTRGRGTSADSFSSSRVVYLLWWVEAAEQLNAFSADFLRKWQINQVQLDALYAVLSALRAGELSAAEAVEPLVRSPHWGWTAIAPETKRLWSVQGGERHLGRAQAMLHHITQLGARGCGPLFLSNGYAHYLPALGTHCGCWVQPSRRQATGPTPRPRWRPLPALLYAQVVKTRRRRRLVEVKHRVVFGTNAAVDQVLAACGWRRNTAFVERLTLRLRQRGAARGRRRATPCKKEEGCLKQLALWPADHNCVLPHARLRQALPEPGATNGWGAARGWWPGTPAMAAGLTDRVWSRRAVLLCRGPPWPRPQTVGASTAVAGWLNG